MRAKSHHVNTRATVVTFARDPTQTHRSNLACQNLEQPCWLLQTLLLQNDDPDHNAVCSEVKHAGIVRHRCIDRHVNSKRSKSKNTVLTSMLVRHSSISGERALFIIPTKLNEACLVKEGAHTKLQGDVLNMSSAACSVVST